jgi:hypothetical protein
MMSDWPANPAFGFFPKFSTPVEKTVENAVFGWAAIGGT